MINNCLSQSLLFFSFFLILFYLFMGAGTGTCVPQGGGGGVRGQLAGMGSLLPLSM